jgi:hypothetical protein
MFSLLWMALAVVAGILWMGGVFSLLVGVVFGFIAFGLVFMGMMCVLPGTVSHPVKDHSREIRAEKPQRAGAVVAAYRSA